MFYLTYIKSLVLTGSIIITLVVVHVASVSLVHICCAADSAMLVRDAANGTAGLANEAGVSLGNTAAASNMAHHNMAQHLDTIGDDCDSASCGNCVTNGQMAQGGTGMSAWVGDSQTIAGSASGKSAAVGQIPPPPRLS